MDGIRLLSHGVHWTDLCRNDIRDRCFKSVVGRRVAGTIMNGLHLLEQRKIGYSLHFPPLASKNMNQLCRFPHSTGNRRWLNDKTFNHPTYADIGVG